MTARGTVSTFAAWLLALGCSPTGPRDVVPETHDVHVDDAGASGAKPGAYAHVAKRPHAAIGLAGTKNIDEAEAKRIVDKAADDFERCAEAQQAEGKLVEGAARLVVAGSANGAARIGDTELAPGGAVAANALLCLIAPLRAAAFPPAKSSDAPPAILIEATWGPSGRAIDGGAPDAGR